MSLLPEYRKPFLGWVCYDADCRFCSRLADSVRNLLSGRGFKLIPLQNAWLTQRFDLRPPYTEMALITDRGVYHGGRSEEHTSELQSPDHLVCRLLLEKKKKKIQRKHKK